jgi:DmsE family decaheme c-type cytochrome
MRRFFWSIFVCELLVIFLPLTLHAAGGPANSSDAPPLSPTSTADFVGAKRCVMCHSSETKGLDRNPHSKLALEHDGKGVTCEGCHGPGKAHVESGGDKTKIFAFSTASSKQIDHQCLNCHQGDHASFDRSAHGEAKVNCTNCHSVHKSEDHVKLLKASQPTLCYTCHVDVKPAFSKPFHHKVNEGLMQCTDCHDPHGTFQKSMVHAAAQDDAVCVKCHQENAGPFIYEHPVVKTEGCTFCHSPHGSANPRLLARNNMNELCLQCHTGLKQTQFTAGGPPTSPVHDQNMQYTSCIICHSQIHGSNVVDTFIR